MGDKKSSASSSKQQPNDEPSTSNANPNVAGAMFEYEQDPAKRSEIANALLGQMRGIIKEYSVTTGEQISGVFVEKPNVPVRDYQIYGTQPLSGVMRELRDKMDTQFNEKLLLPPLPFDDNITQLEHLTQKELKKFIPYMIKCVTKRNRTGWNDPALKPAWWPADIPWANIRFDNRTVTNRKREKWSIALRRIVSDCYKYYKCENMLSAPAVPDAAAANPALPSTSKST